MLKLAVRPLIATFVLVTMSPFATLGHVPSAQAQTQTEKTPVAVLDLTAKGDASAPEAGALTDRVRSLVVQSQVFQVMEREAMGKIMREQGFQTSQDCEGDACSIQIGRLLAVRQILTGSLTRLGRSYSLNLRMIDTERGTILHEEFLDCDCNLDILMREKLPALVALLVGSPAQARIQPTPAPAADTRPIRKARPWMLLVTAGNLNTVLLEGQFNFNEYFAIHAGGGFGFAYPHGYTIGSGILNTAQLNVIGGAKVYFNPHDLAGFADISLNTNNWINGTLGVEYRHPIGLSFSAAAGMGFSIRAVSPGFLITGGVGYAF